MPPENKRKPLGFLMLSGGIKVTTGCNGLEKAVPENLAIFTGKHVLESLYNKVTGQAFALKIFKFLS